MTRSFFEFDLASFDPSKIGTASIYLYGYLSAESTVCVQKGTQAAIITTADFDSFEGVKLGELLWTTGQNIIVLNSTGLSYVKSRLGVGSVKFCLREVEHDYNNVAPGTSATWFNGMEYMQTAYTALRPRLIMTYY